MSDIVDLREDLYDEVDGGRLLANKCSSCGQIYFPKAPFCFECLEKNMEALVLSRRGRLYSYTVGRMDSTHFKAPYSVGLVDLPEGVRVFAPLHYSESEHYRVGMLVEVLIDGLWEENGKRVRGYKFRPLDVAE